MSLAVIMWFELFPDERRKPSASACRVKSYSHDGKRDGRWDCRDPCRGGGQTFYLLLGVVSVGSPGGLGTHHVVQVNP